MSAEHSNDVGVFLGVGLMSYSVRLSLNQRYGNCAWEVYDSLHIKLQKVQEHEERNIIADFDTEKDKHKRLKQTDSKQQET